MWRFKLQCSLLIWKAWILSFFQPLTCTELFSALPRQANKYSLYTSVHTIFFSLVVHFCFYSYKFQNTFLALPQYQKWIFKKMSGEKLLVIEVNLIIKSAEFLPRTKNDSMSGQKEHVTRFLNCQQATGVILHIIWLACWLFHLQLSTGHWCHSSYHLKDLQAVSTSAAYRPLVSFLHHLNGLPAVSTTTGKMLHGLWFLPFACEIRHM